jgi:hypothetical protein
MNFTFRKEKEEDRYMRSYGLLDYCWMYTITDKDRKIGRFFKSNFVSFFAFEEEDIRIDSVYKFLKKTQYPIIDQKTNNIIGGYDRELHFDNRTPYGKLFLGDNTYQCANLKPDVKHMFLRKDTWGHFKIRVGNGSEAVSYTLKTDHPSIWSYTVGDKPFEGQIELEGNNLMLLFAGIFLLEQVLEFEDAKKSDIS